MTPPLLRKMSEIPVGEIVVYGDRIVEPKTGCLIARNFPSRDRAIEAARAMNKVADWFGIIKTRAAGGRPNCQDELKRIAEEFGGLFGDDNSDFAVARCAAVVAKNESRA
jgi:hypothetical protein